MELNQNAEYLSTDIVVIGGGGSGLMSAIAAVDVGAKNILVLEKASKLGGNTSVSHGIFAINSPAQKRLGIKNVDVDEVFRDKMAYVNWRVNARLVRTIIDRSADMIQWLENRGLRFNYVIQFIPEGDGPRTFHKYNSDLGGAIGEHLVETLTKECQKKGINFILDTTVKKILVDHGEVTGVVAAKGTHEIRIIAKSVIIATGGFGANKELLNKYFPFHGDVNGISLPQMTGDGLLMAEEAGAFIENQMAILLTGPGNMETGAGLLFRRPEMVFINILGERFVDESLGLRYVDAMGSSLSRQPGKNCWLLTDSSIVREIIQKRDMLTGLEKDMGQNGIWLDNLENSLERDSAAKKIKKANEWDEIAGWIGTRPEVLKNTIAQYNSYCEEGHDMDFLKNKAYLKSLLTPPFYAIQGLQSFDTTLGGIRINHRTEVLNRQDEWIRGLYAVGDNATGCESVSYNHKYPGSALAFALISGQIAGENSAVYANSKNK